MTKLTKIHERINKLNAHYSALESLATICKVENPNGKKLSLQLLKLERAAYKIVLDYCNGDNGVSTDNWEGKVEPMRQEVIRLFNGNLRGFYINSDARGRALKINDKQLNQYYINTGLTRDWVGNGLLAPDIS